MQEDGEIQGFFQELTAARAMNGSGGCGMTVQYLYMYLMGYFFGVFFKNITNFPYISCIYLSYLRALNVVGNTNNIE